MATLDRFEELALATLSDPTASTDERTKAETILAGPPDFDDLDDAEYELALYIVRRLQGLAGDVEPEPYTSRDLAWAARAWADKKQYEFEEVSAGRPMPPKFFSRCERCKNYEITEDDDEKTTEEEDPKAA